MKTKKPLGKVGGDTLLTSETDLLSSKQKTSPLFDRPLPKWYRMRARASIKKQVISDILKDYEKPVKLTGTQSFQPTELDVKEYMDELYKLSIDKLVQIGRFEEAKTKLSFMDKVAKMKKRKALLITVYHKNGSRTHYVCARHTRVVKINEHLYLCPPNMGNYDNKYNMMSYSYYENNPFPIQYADNFKTTDPKGITMPDGELLKSTNDFEFAQRLAQSNLKDKINLALIFAALAFFAGIANVVLTLHFNGVF